MSLPSSNLRSRSGPPMGDAAERARHDRRPTMLLTRSEDDCAVWAEKLERRGFASVCLPCIAAEPIDSPDLRRELRAAADAADWIVFTSRRGVEAYARLAATRAARRDGGLGPRVAVVGPATAEAASRELGRVDLVGEAGTAASLARTLAAALRGSAGAVVVLALAANARDTLEHELRSAGVSCRRIDVYRTVPAKPRAPRTPLASLGVDAVLLASPSAVQGFANQVEIDASAPLVAIGPTTSAALRALGFEAAREAREPTLDALLDAALEAVPRAAAHASGRTGTTASEGGSSETASSETELRETGSLDTGSPGSADPDDGRTPTSANQTETPHA